MSDRLRAFLAVQLPEAARACTGQAIEILRGVTPGGVRWTAPESQHLTLKFLGEIPEDRVDALVERANAKLAGLAPVELALGGFGAFPSAREARVRSRSSPGSSIRPRGWSERSASGARSRRT